MKNSILLIIITFLFYSYSYANSEKDSLIDFSFYFHNDYSKAIHVKIIDEYEKVILSHSIKKESRNQKLLLFLTKRDNYSLQVEHPKQGTFINKVFHLDNSLASVEIKIAFTNTQAASFNNIYVYKHYKNDLNLILQPNWKKKASAFQSSAIPDFTLTNTQDSIIYGIRYHFSPTLSLALPKLDEMTYPYIMVYKNSIWTPLNCTPPDISMQLKKGEQSNMKTSSYSICTEENFNKNNLYKLVVPYGINNSINEKIADDFFYSEQKIYKVTEEFIFAKPRIKLSQL